MAVTADATNDTSVLLTERLELSFGTTADANVLFPFLHGDEGRAITDFLIWDGPDSPLELAGYFRLHAAGTFGDAGFHWLLRDRSGELSGQRHRALGSIGVRPAPELDSCEIGYWLAPPFWGRGLMAEAITAVVDHAFGHMGYEAVRADVFAHNERGLALLDKLSFARVAGLPDYVMKRGRRVDGVAFAITRAAWKARPHS